MRLKSIFLYFFIILIKQNISAQHLVKIKITDKENNPIVYGKIVDLENKFSSYSDENGYSDAVLNNKIVIHHPMFKSDTFLISNSEVNTIQLSKKELNILEEVHFTTSFLRIYKSNFSFQSYNKFVATVDEKSKSKYLVNPFVRLFFPNLYQLKGDHHIAVSEHFSEKHFKKNKFVKEYVLESKSSGMKDASIIQSAFKIQSNNFIEKQITINGASFANPLNSMEDFRYFKIDDSTYYFIQNKTKNTKSINGIIFTSTYKLVKYVSVFSEKNIKVPFEIHASFLFNNETKDNLPYKIFSKTISKLNEHAKSEFKILNTLLIKNYKFNSDRIHEKSVVVDNVKKHTKNTYFINKNRKTIPFTETDSNTYLLFYSDSVKIDNLFKTVNLLKNNKLKSGKVNLLLDNFIKINGFEGLRIGAGAETNEDFNEKVGFGSFIGYGFKDQRIKYGAYSYINLNKKKESTIKLYYSNDVNEPAFSQFDFSKRLFFNESYRKYAIVRMQENIQYGIKFETNIFNNLKLSANYKSVYLKQLYQFSFDSTRNYILHDQLKFTVRYAFGEKFIKTKSGLFSLGTNFPIVWFSYSFNTKNNYLNNVDNFNKYELKIEKSASFFRFGQTTYQLMAGYVKGDLPYPLLFNIKGSYRPGTPVINNSFNTMGYNEFACDKYFAAFISHNFGKISDDKVFKPEFIILHHFGYGTLKNIDKQNYIVIRGIEKGFYESGFYFKNLLTFQNLIGQTGFGCGAFYRYGHYTNSTNTDNLVFKFSVDFSL